MTEKTTEKKTLRQKIKAKKDVLLKTSLLLFVVCYPLSHMAAGSGNGLFMGVAVGLCTLGCALASVL